MKTNNMAYKHYKDETERKLVKYNEMNEINDKIEEVNAEKDKLLMPCVSFLFIVLLECKK